MPRQVRSLTAALRRADCAALRAEVAAGDIGAEELLAMPPERLMGPERRAALEADRRESLRAVVVGSGFGLFNEARGRPPQEREREAPPLPASSWHWT